MSSQSKCKYGPTNTFIITSPIGDLELVSCQRGVHSLTQPSGCGDEHFKPITNTRVCIKSQLYQDNGYTYKPALNCILWLQQYFHPTSQQLPPLPPICHLLNIGPQASFSQRVWRTLAETVEYGQTVSYSQLAKLSGSSSKASRAVGQAMRRNPVMILVACHRVILSSGDIGNYNSGKRNNVKIWLLQHERQQNT